MYSNIKLFAVFFPKAKQGYIKMIK